MGKEERNSEEVMLGRREQAGLLPRQLGLSSLRVADSFLQCGLKWVIVTENDAVAAVESSVQIF